MIEAPTQEGNKISFTRALAPEGQPQWKDLSAIENTFAISFAACDEVFPTYHSNRGVVKVQLSSTSAIQSSSYTRSPNIFILHGALMLLSFGVLIPIGIFYAKFYKKSDQWLDIHKTVSKRQI